MAANSAAPGSREGRRHLMNKTSFLLLATAIPMWAQPATPQDELIRLVRQGQYVQVRQAAAKLIEEAAQSATKSATKPAKGLPYRAGLQQLLGLAEANFGHFAEAERAFEHGIELCGRSQPAAPETLVSLLVSLAETHTTQAHFRQADLALRRAGQTAAGLSSDHPLRASIFDGWGVFYLAQRKGSQAEASFRRALAILEQHLGPHDPQVASEANGLASLLVSMGRQSEALPLIERGRNVLLESHGPNHPETFFATYLLGRVQIESAPAEAEKMLRAAIEAWRTTQPERHTNLAMLLNALASARHRQGDLAEAIALGSQALAISRDLLGPEHPRVMDQLYERAQLLKAAKRGKEAAALKKEADRIRAQLGDSEPGRHTIDIRALRGR